MFGKVAADVLGTSDIGMVIKPADYNKVDSDDYVMHEEGEKIYFLIKSKSDEYCFTNQALVHLDGTSAMSKKRMLKRYSYARNLVGEVFLETAGTLDRDVEIKFSIGDQKFSIDVQKSFISELKDLYKALIKIAEIQHENTVSQQHAQQSIATAVNAVGKITNRTESDLSETFKTVNQYAFDWMQQSRAQYVVHDFGKVYEKFINN
ncbi:MAG: hypothetical protein CVV27_09345 [Candidatus Melainabacteria bacterium HGW-Melainabacteria-1]|nr:MAG: hypothetical protein CVV27_09345 [Candidatus Melainabacteria bacterium HGW-Melainabacteria-1]